MIDCQKLTFWSGIANHHESNVRNVVTTCTSLYDTNCIASKDKIIAYAIRIASERLA